MIPAPIRTLAILLLFPRIISCLENSDRRYLRGEIPRLRGNRMKSPPSGSSMRATIPPGRLWLLEWLPSMYTHPSLLEDRRIERAQSFQRRACPVPLDPLHPVDWVHSRGYSAIAKPAFTTASACTVRTCSLHPLDHRFLNHHTKTQTMLCKACLKAKSRPSVMSNKVWAGILLSIRVPCPTWTLGGTTSEVTWL